MPWGNNNQGPWGGGPPKPPLGSGSGGGSGGGNKPPPPDLDALFRKGQDNFKKMFPGDGDNSRVVTLVVLAVLAFWAASGIYFVKADEQGVVTRFGKYHRTDQPGMNYHLPYPMERVQTPRVTNVNRVEVGFSSNARSNGIDDSAMLTGDENIVDINFEVQWKILNAPDYLFNVRNPEDTVKTVAQSAMREVVGKTTIVTVLSEGAGKLLVEQNTKKLMQEMLNNYKSGVEVVAVNLLKADPPAQVLDAFRDVQSARADLETARNQAEAYRNDILPRARGEAEKLVLDAEAYKQEVVARAQGEAARFVSVYNEFKVAKDVTKKRMYLETMEDILQGMNKVIMDGKNNVVPYMSLPALAPKKEEEKAP